MTTESRTLTEITGAFYGNALSSQECSQLYARYFPKSRLKQEVGLVSSCWFDYRFVHPVVRAHLFHHEFTKAHCRAFRRFYGREPRDMETLPLGRRNFCNAKKQARIQLLSLQAYVDELCMPYGVFLDAGFAHLMQEREFTRGKWTAEYLKGRKLPPPGVFRDGEVMLAAQRRFEEINQATLTFAQHPFYRISSYTGHPFQRDHQRYLVCTALQRGIRAVPTLETLMEMDLLDERAIARVAGLDRVRQVRERRACLSSQC